MNKAVMLLFLAVFAVYQVQGYSLYNRLFEDEGKDLDPLEKIMQWSSQVERKREETCIDLYPGYCSYFKNECAWTNKKHFLTTANFMSFREKVCCETCAPYPKLE